MGTIRAFRKLHVADACLAAQLTQYSMVDIIQQCQSLCKSCRSINLRRLIASRAL